MIPECINGCLTQSTIFAIIFFFLEVMVIKGKYLFTSESVSEGHPDKICDQISDAILDACLQQDPDSRVAVECLIKTGVVVVAGELSTKGYVNIPSIVRETLRDFGLYALADIHGP